MHVCAGARARVVGEGGRLSVSVCHITSSVKLNKITTSTSVEGEDQNDRENKNQNKKQIKNQNKNQNKNQIKKMF